MVKFQKRVLKRSYKNKEHHYKRYSIEFPAKLNQKIEPHETKKFDSADIDSKDSPTQEFINISLVRRKTRGEKNNESS